MPQLSDAKTVSFRGRPVKALWLGGRKVWPTAPEVGDWLLGNQAVRSWFRDKLLDAKLADPAKSGKTSATLSVPDKSFNEFMACLADGGTVTWTEGDRVALRLSRRGRQVRVESTATRGSVTDFSYECEDVPWVWMGVKSSKHWYGY